MYRYVWQAFYDDGTVIDRFTPEGKEQSPDPWRTRQFKLYSFTGEDPITMYVPRGSYFHFFKRRCFDQAGEQGTIFVTGWTQEEYGFFLFHLPDRSIECASSVSHITAYERS